MRFVHLLPLLLLPACLSGTAPSADDLLAARAAWSELGPPAYSYQVTFLCECPEEQHEGTFRVVVRNGGVVDRVPEALPLPAAGYEGRYPAVEGLFAVIQDAIARKAENWTISYHSQLGYPTLIDLNFRRDRLDDQYIYLVRDFVVDTAGN